MKLTDRMKEERERFDEHQHGHQVVNFERVFPPISNDVGPQKADHEEYDGQEKVQIRQWYFAGRQVTVVIFLFNEKRQIDQRRFETFAVKTEILTIVKKQTVQSFAVMVRNVDLKLDKKWKST